MAEFELDATELARELDAAYGLLLEFWNTVESSMEGDHPAKERLDGWLTRFEQSRPTS